MTTVADTMLALAGALEPLYWVETRLFRHNEANGFRLTTETDFPIAWTYVSLECAGCTISSPELGIYVRIEEDLDTAKCVAEQLVAQALLDWDAE